MSSVSPFGAARPAARGWSPVIETKHVAVPPLAAPGGRISGYASLFGVADLSGDRVVRGAFRDSLARRGARAVRMLFQHDPAEPIGLWERIVEDARGLRVEGRLNLAVARAREVAALIAQGAVDGLSIGFKTRTARRDAATGLRDLLALELWEISIVTFPMLPGARVEMTKARPTLAPPAVRARRR